MHLRDFPVLVDDVRDAFRVLILRIRRGAVRQAEFAVDIGEQWKGELVLLGESRIVGGRIEAGAEDLDVFRAVVVVEVPEPGTFQRSTGCVGLREEPKQDFLAAKITQLDPLAAMIDDIELRCGIADLQH